MNKRRFGTGLFSSLRCRAVAAAIILMPGVCRADDCAVIYSAFEALAKAPAYSQTVAMADMPAIKAIVIGETFYAHDGTKWTKITLKPGGRAGMLAQFVPDAGSLKDCRASGAEEIAGRAMSTYTFVPSVPKGMEQFAPANPEQKVWIGDADGLPYRMAGEGMEVTISFEAVEPPI